MIEDLPSKAKRLFRSNPEFVKDFLGLPWTEKRKLLLDFSPRFRGLPLKQKEKFLQDLTLSLTAADLTARYQRWRGSLGNQVPAPEDWFERNAELEFQSLHSYTVKAAFKTEGSWPKTISYMALAWLVIHLALVAVRGAVLYVAVGRFLPVSGLRGWLTL